MLRSTTWTPPLQWVMWWFGGKGLSSETRLQMLSCSAASRIWTLSTHITPATQEVSYCYYLSHPAFVFLKVWNIYCHFLRYCNAEGWGPLGAADPSFLSKCVPGFGLHLPGCCQTGLMCVTSLWTPGMLFGMSCSTVLLTSIDVACCVRVYGKQPFLYGWDDSLCDS